jgi:cytochrome c oxidase subunit 2
VSRLWSIFFIFWPIAAIVSCLMAPAMGWWFPGDAGSPLGQQIDDLFYLILVITTVTFIGTQIALGYVLWRGSVHEGEKALFTHGSHNLEVIWSIVPAGILLFIALYQMDVWAQYRIQANFPEEAREAPVAEVTARQFEWRIRYPAPGKKLMPTPQPDDLYAVNDLHVPTRRPVMIQLRTDDVQHSFFVPVLRVKQDALPGQVIPVWFEVIRGEKYEMVCAELCGWGHYKMKAQVWAQPDAEFQAYLKQLQQEQFDDGVADEKPDQESNE